VSARVGVVMFPGTNSEDETLRACLDAGLDAALVHWSAPPPVVRAYDGYVLSGGFSYEDRIRAGAIAAHHPLMDVVIEGAQAGKPVLGICNGAQILLETGLVPGTAPVRRPTAAFAPNAPGGHFVCRHVHVRLTIEPSRCRITASMARDTVLPAWAAHGEGRLVAQDADLETIRAGAHVAFVYSDEHGNPVAPPNGSAFGAAALTNVTGNVLAIMPHCERDAWTFQRRDGAERAAARGHAGKILAPSGGMALFRSFAKAF